MAYGLFRGSLKHFEEGAVGGSHGEVGVENHERRLHSFHSGSRVHTGFGHFGFERVNIQEHQHGAFQLVVHSSVRPHAEGIPAALLILDLDFAQADGLDRSLDELFQARDLDRRPEVADRPADVARNEVEKFFRDRRKTPDAKVASHHNDGDIDGGEQVVQVAVQRSQFDIAILQFFVEGGQLLVG